jgi:restriction endonuclease Mrr
MTELEMPSNDVIERQLLRFLLLRSRPIEPKKLYGPLAEAVGLTSQQLRLRRKTTEESLWHNLVQTARNHLVRRGLMDNSQRGFWSLTPKGNEAARMHEKLGSPTLEDLGL